MSRIKHVLITSLIGPFMIGHSHAQSTSADNPRAKIIEEIIVQARRRDENIQDVPLAITALSGESLKEKGIVTTEDLIQKTPSLHMGPATGRRDTVTLGIRSQRNIQSRLDQDPSVAVYFADVTVTRPYGINQGFYDIESIQVLKGPQGTLFGRNTTGGALLIQPKRPSEELEGSLEFEVGNYNSNVTTGVLNLPINDKLAVRIAGRRAERDGFTDNLFSGKELDGVDNYSFRGSINYKLTDDIQNYLVYDSYRSDDSGTSSVLTDFRPTGLGPIFFPGLADALEAQKARDYYTVDLDGTTYSKVYVQGIGNVTEFDRGNIKIKNIFGWRRTELNAFNDFDGSPYPILHVGLLGKIEQFSNEIQIQGTTLDSKLEWILGAYYFREKGSDYTPVFGVGGLVSFTNGGRARNESRSIFGQATYIFDSIPELRLTAGIRHTWDYRLYDFRVTSPDGSCAFFVGGVAAEPCSVRDDDDWTSPTWSLGLDYQLSDQMLAYIVTRRGYRSGGYNSSASTDSQAFPPFDQEEITDVELGLKSDWYLGETPIRTNLAIYYAKGDDIQRSISPGQAGVRRVVNAASAKFYGVEFEGSIEPIENLLLSLFYSYDDNSYDDFVDAGIDVSDSEFPFVPKNKFGLGIRYEHSLSNSAGSLVFNLNYYFQDDMFSNTLNSLEPESKIDSYELSNASIEWDNIYDTQIYISLFGRNIFDEEYANSGNSQVRDFGINVIQSGEPRMYGVRFRYNF